MQKSLIRLQRGFTLIELLVAIGIIVLLLSITVPVGMRMMAGNQLMTCEANLAKLHQALRLYRMDEGGFPPYYYDDSNQKIMGRGLLALIDTGCLRSGRTLNCPLDEHEYAEDPVTDYSSADFNYDKDDAISYQWIDEEAGSTNIPAFKYLTDRGVGGSDADYHRIPHHGKGSTYQPDDSALITWCQHHQKVIRADGKGQYLALFYNGRVAQRAAGLFQNGDGWRVKPQ